MKQNVDNKINSDKGYCDSFNAVLLRNIDTMLLLNMLLIWIKWYILIYFNSQYELISFGSEHGLYYPNPVHIFSLNSFLVLNNGLHTTTYLP